MTDMITPNVPAIASRAAILGADMTIPPVAPVVFTPCSFLASDRLCLLSGPRRCCYRVDVIDLCQPAPRIRAHSADTWGNPALSSNLVRYGAVVPGAGCRV